MKTYIITFFFINFFCFSQQITDYKNLYTDNRPSDDQPSNPKYYKDINNYFTPFIGTWKYTNGDKTFIVTLWKDEMRAYPSSDIIYYYTDNIFGHYKMVQNYGTPNQVVLYTSEINVGLSTTQWPSVIYAASIESNKLGGHLYDINTEPANSQFWPLRGSLTMTINPNSNPLTAHWKITNSEEKIIGGRNYNFVIPTDIILTKE